LNKKQVKAMLSEMRNPESVWRIGELSQAKSSEIMQLMTWFGQRFGRNGNARFIFGWMLGPAFCMIICSLVLQLIYHEFMTWFILFIPMVIISMGYVFIKYVNRDRQFVKEGKDSINNIFQLLNIVPELNSEKNDGFFCLVRTNEDEQSEIIRVFGSNEIPKDINFVLCFVISAVALPEQNVITLVQGYNTILGGRVAELIIKMKMKDGFGSIRAMFEDGVFPDDFMLKVMLEFKKLLGDFIQNICNVNMFLGLTDEQRESFLGQLREWNRNAKYSELVDVMLTMNASESKTYEFGEFE